MTGHRHEARGLRVRRLPAPACAVLTVTLLVLAGWAQAATPAKVTRSVGERGAPQVSFKADRRVTGNDWYLVEVRAASKQSDCEYYESVQIAPTRVGQRVTLRLRPYDRHRWCVGRYAGRILHQKRASCEEPDVDESYCGTSGRVTARFTFDVR